MDNIDLSMDNFGPRNPQRPNRQRKQYGRAPQSVSTAGAAPAERPRPQPATKPSAGNSGAAKPQPRKPQPKSEVSLVEKVSAFFNNTRTRLAIAITLLITAVVWLIVAIDYFKTGIADQSLASSMSVGAMAEAAEGVESIGGALGAKWAHLMMVDGIGIASVVLIVYLGVISLSLFGMIRIRFWAFTFKCLFTAIAASIILGFFTYNAASTIHWGGNHGHYVNWWLMHIGSGLFALATTIFLIGMLSVMYLTQLISFYKNVSGNVRRAREAMIQAAGKARKTSTDLADVPNHSDPKPETDAQASGNDNPAPEATPAAPAIVGFSIDDIEDVPDSPAEASAKLSIFDEFPIDAPVASAPEAQEAPEASVTSASESSEEPVEAPAAQDPVVVSPAPTSSTAPVAAVAAPAVVAESRQNVRGGNNVPAEPEFVINDPAEAPVIPEIRSEALEDTPEDQLQPFDIRDELSRYKFPTEDILIDRPMTLSADTEEQEENKNMIVNTLRSFGIGIAKISATIGPTITLYEIVPAEGVRISQIRSLEDDIALQLEALGIRIIAPIPGKGTIGIEVPNRDPQTVSMLSVITSKEFRECKMQLPMALGSTINNRMFVADLAKMPHLLVAGATGQGKSVGLNCIIASLLYKKHPGELKFVLIDPKMVEFSLYSRLEHHFLAMLPGEDEPIVTDANKALSTLASLCVEMDNRYDLLKEASVRTVEEYNHKFAERRLNPEKGHRYMPYIVIIVDEFADLIMTAGKDITLYIARIAQKARAVGMHMIIATQRPSTDIITGMIKANFPGRIAFRVAQMVDSKTILDRPGANRLIGRGDMLFSHNSMMERVQCAFIDTPEVVALVDHIAEQVGFPSAYILPEPPVEGGASAVAPGSVDLSKRDELFDDCARFVSQNPTASTSLLQRRFGIGYAKAGKIMDQLEAAGIVGPALGQKPRAVLIDSFGIEDKLASL